MNIFKVVLGWIAPTLGLNPPLQLAASATFEAGVLMRNISNAFRNAFDEMCVRYGIAVEKEAECLAGRRPADILLIQWSRGQHVAVDFVCTHPAGLAEHPLVVDNAIRHCNLAECTRTAPHVTPKGGGSHPLP